MDELTIQKMQTQFEIDSTHDVRTGGNYRDTWRIFRIMAELVEGYSFLSKLSREVTILGSARFPEDHPYAVEARKLGNLLGKNGFTTITGGGPGIMQAANRGAFEVDGESIGLNIQLPFEQRINPYVKKATAFYYFFTRKVMLTSPANAFVFFPGGYGTLDEFFEVVDLMEMGMLSEAPIVLVGKEFWEPVLNFMREQASGVGAIQEEQMASWRVVETAEEAYECIKDSREERAVCDLSPNNFHRDGNIDWKIFRVMAELVEGFEFVSGLRHAVTVLGTKNINIDSTYYTAGHTLGKMLAEKKYAVVTGAKFGIAEAVNKGAFEAGGTSVGIGMKVGSGRGSQVNAYLSKSILFDFPFTRKVIMGAPTLAFVFFPGGFGTMHHLFEILTLIQTKKINPLPVILYDEVFWRPLGTYINEMLVQKLGTISPGDEAIYTIVNSEAEVVNIIETWHSDTYGSDRHPS